MNRVVSTLLGIVLLAAAFNANAILISVEPEFQKVEHGDEVGIDLFISGLGAQAAPSLGAYDLRVLFNPSVLEFQSLVFGDPILGNELNLSGFGTINGFAPDPNPSIGAVELFEISLDSPAVLDSLQSPDFILASLTFTALMPGRTIVTLATPILADAFGNPLAASVRAGTVLVPEPSTALLMLLGIFAVVGGARIRGALEDR